MQTATVPFTPEPVTNEPMYCLFAPDGNWQPSTLAPDFASCVAFMQMLHDAKLSASFHDLCIVGDFKILPVSVTATVTGDEKTAFRR